MNGEFSARGQQKVHRPEIQCLKRWFGYLLSMSDHTHTEPPLWSIGIAVAIILVTPLVLYSLAPTGPFRENDTVFSNGQQRAQITKPVPSLRDPSDNTCMLDPNSPLIILQAPQNHVNGSFVAEVQGNPSGEWPFCQVHTEVLLGTHQVFQKPAVFEAIRETMMRLFDR